MLIIYFRAIILYIVIVFSIRLMGKRQLGELQPSEFVVAILISDIATLPVEDVNIPMIMGIVPILTIVCLDVFISALSLKSKKIRKIVCGSPKIVIKDGIIDQKVLKDLRFSIDDLIESLRAYNIFDVSDVQFAVVETTGSVSVYQKYDKQSVSAQMLGLNGQSKNPPQILIDDGVLNKQVLYSINLDDTWLNNILNKNNIAIKEIFLFTADETGEYNMIKKEK